MTDKKQKKQKKSNGSSRSCCPWVFGSLLLFGGIASLIAYDTNVLHNGIFEESSLGRVLKQTGKFSNFIKIFAINSYQLKGTLPHVENAWFVSLKYSARGYKWVEANAPTAYNRSVTFLAPYGELAKDVGITVLNVGVKGWDFTKQFVSEKIPVVLDFIDKYVPGLGQKIADFTSNTFKGFCSITSNVWRQSVDFFKQKVFV